MKKIVYVIGIPFFMIFNVILFWDKINWLRGMVIYFQIVLVFMAWLSFNLGRKNKKGLCLVCNKEYKDADEHIESHRRPTKKNSMKENKKHPYKRRRK